MIEVYEAKPGEPLSTEVVLALLAVPPTLPAIGDRISITTIDNFTEGGAEYRVVERVFNWGIFPSDPKVRGENDLARYMKVWIFVEPIRNEPPYRLSASIKGKGAAMR